MADKLRNEIIVRLDGADYTLRATFAAIRGIERDLGINLVPLIERLSRKDFGVEQAAVVIWHGLRGNGDTEMKLDQVGELVMATGLGDIMLPIVEFLTTAMEGVSLGKPLEKAPA